MQYGAAAHTCTCTISDTAVLRAGLKESAPGQASTCFCRLESMLPLSERSRAGTPMWWSTQVRLLRVSTRSTKKPAEPLACRASQARRDSGHRPHSQPQVERAAQGAGRAQRGQDHLHGACWLMALSVQPPVHSSRVAQVKDSDMLLAEYMGRVSTLWAYRWREHARHAGHLLCRLHLHTGCETL